jgi:hypothetical protein
MLPFSHNKDSQMLFRTRRAARPSPRLNLETLESRTLLSNGPTSFAEAMFATSYAAAAPAARQ